MIHTLARKSAFWTAMAAGLAAVLGASSAAPAMAAATRPNIVLIIADDLGCDDTGVFGHPRIRTPNLDRLAREALRFDRAFLTCSSCSPSRASLITGRYPHATGAEELHRPLPAGQVTFVERLKAAGYWTAAAGKWHLGAAAKPRFDRVEESNAGRGGDARSGCDRWIPTLRDRPRGRPFFLWLASFDPHRDYEPGTIPTPHRPEDAVVPAYLPDVPEVREDLARYYDEITRLDGFVGAVLAELDRQGEASNTVVLFLSDNGRPFPRCKTTLYDSGIRTPLLVRWPGTIPPGGRSPALVSSVDIAPTLLELAGVDAPSTFQGKSVVPLLRDPTARVREHIFAEHNWHDYAAFGRAVRSERFKYIRNLDRDLPNTPPADAVRSPTFRAMRRLRDAGKLAPEQSTCFTRPRAEEELYDTETDPHELHDLARDPAFAATLATLRRTLAGWQEETGDRADAARSPDRYDRETGVPLPDPRKGDGG